MTQQGLSPGISAKLRESLGSPPKIDTPSGAMEFFDGVPTAATVELGYDVLALLRGIDVYLNCVPGASMLAMRNGLRSVGARSNVIACTDPRSTSAPVVLTANTETTYGTTFLDLKNDGPTVVEALPNSLCFVDDLWPRYVADMGNAGPDRGRGGKYLFLPPDHEGDVPDRYFVFRSPTYSNWLVIRALLGPDSLLTTRIYRPTRSSPSVRPHRHNPTRTGCKPSPARAGSASCASTAHSNGGSTRPGDSERSNPPERGAQPPRPQQMGAKWRPTGSPPSGLRRQICRSSRTGDRSARASTPPRQELVSPDHPARVTQSPQSRSSLRQRPRALGASSAADVTGDMDSARAASRGRRHPIRMRRTCRRQGSRGKT